MKKITILLVALMAASVSFSANAWIYVTSCGIAVQTVSPDFFGDDTEARDAFYLELDDIYCKKDVEPTIPGV